MYQWKKSLQEKEQERLKLLEEALNGVHNRDKYMSNAQVLSAKGSDSYKPVVRPPEMINILDKDGKYKTLNAPSVSNSSDLNDPSDENDKLSQVLGEYKKFKEEADNVIAERRRITDDKSLHSEHYDRRPPPEMPYLRDPALREQFEEERKKGLTMQGVYDEYNQQKDQVRNNQPMYAPGSQQSQLPNQERLQMNPGGHTPGQDLNQADPRHPQSMQNSQNPAREQNAAVAAQDQQIEEEPPADPNDKKSKKKKKAKKQKKGKEAEGAPPAGKKKGNKKGKDENGEKGSKS